MKKYIGLIVILAALISLASCGRGSSDSPTADHSGTMPDYGEIVPDAGDAPAETGDTEPAETKTPESVVSIASSVISLDVDGTLDVLSLFRITENGASRAVTLNMLELGGLDPDNLTAGTYTVTLTYTSADGATHTGTSTVKVLPKGAVTVQIRYTDTRLCSDEQLDIRDIFELFADGAAVEITDGMLNLGGYDQASPAVGTYTLTLTYTSSDGATHSQTAQLTVVRRVAVTVTGGSVTVYEGESVDILSLFTVTADGAAVTVTEDMVYAGRLYPNKASAGDYTVTLIYKSADGCRHTGTAEVHVIRQWIGPFD